MVPGEAEHKVKVALTFLAWSVAALECALRFVFDCFNEAFSVLFSAACCFR